MILRDVSKLTPAVKQRLFEWIRTGTRSQVLSVTDEPLYPLVKQGRFLEDLFYYLNVSGLTCSTSTFVNRSRSRYLLSFRVVIRN